MALNFQQLQNRGGGGQNSVGNLLTSVAAGMPSIGENIQLDVQTHMMNKLQPLVNINKADIETMKGLDATFKVEDAFTAWNELSSGWSKRQKLAAQRAGINPLSFKEAFDNQKLMLVNDIGKKILAYQDMNKFSDNDMRAEFGDMSNIANYISANSSDAAVTNLVTPKRTMVDQFRDMRFIPGPDQTIGEAAFTTGGTLLTGASLYGLGKRAITGTWPSIPGFGGAKTAAKGASAASQGAMPGVGGGPTKTTITQKAKKLFSKGKAPSAKSISSFITNNLGKSRGLAMLARFGPYGALAALIGGAGLALYKNRDNYQEAQDARIGATYGGGPVDTSGAAGIEAARAKLAPYLK